MSDDVLERQGKYFEIQLRGLRSRPELNREQIRAYEEHRRWLSECADGPAWLAKIKSTGNMFLIARAESVDRYRNLEILHQQLGMEHKVRAMATRREAAEKATDHSQLVPFVEAAHRQVLEEENRGNQAIGKIGDLVRGWLEWRVEPDTGRGEKVATLRRILGELEELDPGFTPQKLADYPPYRRRIPLANLHLGEVITSLRELR